MAKERTKDAIPGRSSLENTRYRRQGLYIYLKGTVHGPSYIVAEGRRKLNKVNGVREITEVIGTKETRLSIGRKRNVR